MRLNVVTTPEHATQSPFVPQTGPKRSRTLIVVSVLGIVALVAVAVGIVIMIAATNSSVAKPTPAGRAGAAPEPAPAVVVTPSAPPTAKRYAAPADLQQALEANNVSCTGLTSATGMPSLGISDARCYNVDNTEVILRIYASSTEARSQAALLSRGVRGTNINVGVLVGENWTVICSNRAWLGQVSAYLGGQVLGVE
jgi:hypothetical protein